MLQYCSFRNGYSEQLSGLGRLVVLLSAFSVDPMKVLLIATALAALSLGGCCLFLGGCEVPLAAANTNWDGLTPDAGPSTPSEKTSDRGKSQSKQPKDAYTSATVGNSWKDDDAQLQLDDARLKRKLIICDSCVAAHN